MQEIVELLRQIDWKTVIILTGVGAVIILYFISIFIEMVKLTARKGRRLHASAPSTKTQEVGV